jgi:hypothetical protein
VLGNLTPAVRVVARLGSIVGAALSLLGSSFRLIGDQPGFGSLLECHSDVAIQTNFTCAWRTTPRACAAVGDDPQSPPTPARASSKAPAALFSNNHTGRGK